MFVLQWLTLVIQIHAQNIKYVTSTEVAFEPSLTGVNHTPVCQVHVIMYSLLFTDCTSVSCDFHTTVSLEIEPYVYVKSESETQKLPCDHESTAIFYFCCLPF